MNCDWLIVKQGFPFPVHKQCFAHVKYLQVTFTLTTWLATFPIPLSAVQRYVPVAVLLMFGKFQVGPWCSTSPLLPSSSTLVQVMFGVGLPVASHNNCMFDSSRTVWSRLTLVSLAGTDKSMHTVLVYSYMHVISRQRHDMFDPSSKVWS